MITDLNSLNAPPGDVPTATGAPAARWPEAHLAVAAATLPQQVELAAEAVELDEDLETALTRGLPAWFPVVARAAMEVFDEGLRSVFHKGISSSEPSTIDSTVLCDF